jgi:hypothetical protein
MAYYISIFSDKNNVPVIAVAGSIADEYNTRRNWRIILDWFQDDIVINNLPEFAIEIDAYLDFDSKYFNATKHDIGVANINVATAKAIYDSNPLIFENRKWGYTQIIDYLRSLAGSAHMASLYIKVAKEKLKNHIKHYDNPTKEAILVTYFKQGPGYLERYFENLKKDPSKKLQPGEGCRVCLQRDDFLRIFPGGVPRLYWDKLTPENEVGKSYA